MMCRALFLIVLAGASSAGELVSHPDFTRDIEARWSWALSQAGKAPHAAIAHEVTLVLPEGVWLSGMGWWQSNGENAVSIEGRLAGETRARRLPRRLAVISHLNEGRVHEVRLAMLDAPVEICGDLFWLGPVSPEAGAAHLIARCEAENPEVVDDLIDVLGFHDSDTVTRFLRGIAISDVSRRIREEAVQALARQSAPSAAETVIGLAREEADREVRREAVRALGDFGGDASHAVLMKLAGEDQSRIIRAEAIEVLGEMGRAEGLSLIRGILARADDEDLAEVALEALAHEDGAFDELARIARTHRFYRIRIEAVEHLIEHDPGRASPIVEALIRGERDGTLAAELVETLDDLPTEIAAAALFRVLDSHADPRIQCAAIDALSEHPTDTVMTRLSDIAWRSTDEEVVEEAVSALADLEMAGVGKLLLKLARTHPRESIREEAREALQDRVFDR